MGNYTRGKKAEPRKVVDVLTGWGLLDRVLRKLEWRTLSVWFSQKSRPLYHHYVNGKYRYTQWSTPKTKAFLHEIEQKAKAN